MLWWVRLRRRVQLSLAGLARRAGPVSPELIDLICSIAEPPSPPAGHPERAVPEVPPSPVEWELWADLTGYHRS